ncbi:MAG: NifB/NifX family molybdenum-iron cluster-binding protein [Desulfobulbaceae bacterium]|nr:NifB/NifX family molybdenum-iron cluster-binding protein [Desulfobulbaceae bacterium]MCK5340177.1 NifB/NifX family molybdenum-iron cluster-binding protein [Desulfobulbaceae bacterium]MCK5404871.1 NifB/NifX family molybdenum-iron cluster-binding protein [Desulfobulbaceae bacterium]
MQFKKVAVPTNNPGGLDGQRSDHFGHCDVFTVVNIDDGKIASVDTIKNIDHQEGGCMAPVKLLQDNGVDALIVGGIGGRPLQFFQQVGINVFYAPRDGYHDVEGVIQAMLQNGLASMEPSMTCQGHAH